MAFACFEEVKWWHPCHVQALELKRVGGFNPTRLTKMIVELEHFPKVRGENEKSFKPPPSTHFEVKLLGSRFFESWKFRGVPGHNPIKKALGLWHLNSTVLILSGWFLIFWKHHHHLNMFCFATSRHFWVIFVGPTHQLVHPTLGKQLLLPRKNQLPPRRPAPGTRPDASALKEISPQPVIARRVKGWMDEDVAK